MTNSNYEDADRAYIAARAVFDAALDAVEAVPFRVAGFAARYEAYRAAYVIYAAARKAYLQPPSEAQR